MNLWCHLIGNAGRNGLLFGIMLVSTAAADIVRWDTGELITTLSPGDALQAGVDLSFADLGEQVIAAANGSSATLRHARLDGSQLVGCNFSRADFAHASLIGTHIINGNYSRAQFELSDLRGSAISGANFNRAVLAGADASGSVWEACNFSRMEAAGLDLSGSRLTDLNLTRIEAEGLIAVDLLVDQCNMDRANLAASDLTGMLVSNTCMDRMNLEGCDWSEGAIDHVSLSGSNLRSCFMGGFHLDGSVSWNGACFEDACYNGQSVFPAWFDRQGQGMLPCAGDVVHAAEQVKDLRITAAWPNPFNPATTVMYHLEDPGPVRISVRNILGQEVALLLDAMADRGDGEVLFVADHLSSGTYLVLLEQNGRVDHRSVLLLK